MSELRKWLTLVVGVFLLVLAVSFVAGQCRDWRTPKPRSPSPAISIQGRRRRVR